MATIYAFILSLPLGVFIVTFTICGGSMGWMLGRAYERKRQEEYLVNDGYPREIRPWSD